MDGQPALRVRRGGGESPFDSEQVYVEHDHRLFLVTFDYARDAGEVCRPMWEDLLAKWQWFTPQFAVYRNTDYGYAVSHPRSWYRFDSEARGISISGLDPAGVTDVKEPLLGAMLVKTTVLDNADGAPLKDWLAAQEWQVDLTNDIPLDGIVGVRVLREGPNPGIQQMSGYFQGRLGKIYGDLSVSGGPAEGVPTHRQRHHLQPRILAALGSRIWRGSPTWVSPGGPHCFGGHECRETLNARGGRATWARSHPEGLGGARGLALLSAGSLFRL